MKRLRYSLGFGLILNLILPGAGHIYWREILFGSFVFLVMLIAAVLFFFSFLIDLPFMARIVLLGMPAIFFLFSMIDLGRTIRKQHDSQSQTSRRAWIFLIVTLLAQIALPFSPANFLVQNAPGIHTISTDQFKPVLERGDICLVDPLAYQVDLFFFDHPLHRSYPERWELVRFESYGQAHLTGLVVGLPYEEVAVIDDSLFVDGYPVERPPGNSLDLGESAPLTLAEPGSILVATFGPGTVAEIHQVPTQNIIGKLRRLF